MSTLDDLQARATSLLTRTEGTASVEAKVASVEGPSSRFSAFIPSQLDRATALAGDLIKIREEQDVGAALDEAERRAETEDAGLVRHALGMFIVHDAEASRLALPPTAPPAQRRAAAQLAGAIGREAALDWWREDPAANDHHSHWHLVYPHAGPAGHGAAPGPPERAVLLHARADAGPLRRRAARARLRPRGAVRRLSGADRRGLRGPAGAARRCGTSTAETSTSP